MLKSLHISNYALIDELNINLGRGMSVLTGETGAGKSIIIGALSLVMGQRADSKIVKEGEQKTVVEVEFDVKNYNLHAFFDENELDYIDHTVVRREVSANGKSRAFVNDTPVQLSILKELSDRLLDIHSQHENLLLATENYQLRVVDSIAGNTTERERYLEAFEAWNEAKAELHRLRAEAEKQNADLEYVQFQLTQLDDARLIENEQEELEQELETQSHAEEIKTELLRVESQFEIEEGSVFSAVKDARNAILRIQSYLPQADAWIERLEGALIELKDIVSEVAFVQQRIDFNPERLTFVDNRLGLIYALQKKFKVDSVEDLIELRENFRRQLERVEGMGEELDVAEKRLEMTHQTLCLAAEALSLSRKKVTPFIENQLMERLLLLGMPNVAFAVEIASSNDFTRTGNDTVAFMFSANKNRKMLPVAEIASGGEISRLMLAIKSIQVSKSDLPTIVFDEIDTGVSGDIAARMGEIMEMMSRATQVVVITHLPQIAAKGETHFKVYKDSSSGTTQTFIKQLDKDQRIQEIAQMLSSKKITDAALMNARELMK